MLERIFRAAHASPIKCLPTPGQKLNIILCVSCHWWCSCWDPL